MANSELPDGPLTGIRVLDLTSMISGPVATMMLADQGADVIKVEALSGDLVRGAGPNRSGITSTFISSNRSKRSLSLDLKAETGCRVLRELVQTADVFVQNFRPGTIERMGFGEPEVRQLKADVIYVSISGFGERGPYAHQRVYDPVIQALSGLASIQADGQTGRPKMIRTIIPDKTTAVTAAQAITAALFARERTGTGQHVRLAMLDTMVAYLWPEGMAGLTLVGKEVKAARAQTSAYWLARLDEEGVPCAPVLKREEVIDHPQIVANEIVAEYEHPIAGTTRQPRPAARFDKTPAMIRRPAPGLGEHNTEILAELGYSADEIKRLRDEEVLGA